MRARAIIDRMRESTRIEGHTFAAIAAILVGYLVLAVLYTATVPIWEAPDEVGHYGFVKHLIIAQELPRQKAGELGEAHQPPLYYVLAALPARLAGAGDPSPVFRPNPSFVWAGNGGFDANISLHGSAETFPYRGANLAFRLARSVSILCGLLTVLLSVLLAQRMLQNPWAGILVGSLVVFNPQFLFITSVLNNDNLLVLLSTGAWLLMILVLQRQRLWQWLVLGCVVGLAILSKTAGLVSLGCSGLMLLTVAYQRKSWRYLLSAGSLLLAPILVIAGWWFVRNWVLYGDPLGWSIYEQVFVSNLRQVPLRLADLRTLFHVQWRSYWGTFGWMNVSMPDWAYWGIGVIACLSLIGWLWTVVRAEWSESIVRQMMLWMFLLVLLQEAYVIALNTRCNESCFQGRYMFPAIAPVAIILVGGLAKLPLSGAKRACGPVLCTLLLALAAWVPFGVIAPAYRGATVAKRDLWFVEKTPPVVFGEMVQLLGYGTSRAESDSLNVTLYWKALGSVDFDYSAFVHVLGSDGELLAQKDHAPGADLGYPPTLWWPGDIVRDLHQIALPAGAAPGEYRLRVGLYNWETQTNLTAASSGQPVGQHYVLDWTMPE